MGNLNKNPEATSTNKFKKKSWTRRVNNEEKKVQQVSVLNKVKGKAKQRKTEKI
jgi:hypothetical protein